MFGKNPKRAAEKGSGDELFVQSIFATFQGEGPFVGYPSVFIRLGGCNLACTFCDTEFESFKEIKLNDILEQVEMLAKSKDSGQRIRNLVVITGGEPFRQPIALLCDSLLNRGFEVQIETNGTLYRPVHKSVHIICSPKNTGNGYGQIREDLLERITALKFIISASINLYDHIAEVGQSKFDIPIYLQPMDEYDQDKNLQNMKHTVKLADKIGARICVQMHKYLGIE